MCLQREIHSYAIFKWDTSFYFNWYWSKAIIFSWTLKILYSLIGAKQSLPVSVLTGKLGLKGLPYFSYIITISNIMDFIKYLSYFLMLYITMHTNIHNQTLAMANKLCPYKSQCVCKWVHLIFKCNCKNRQMTQYCDWLTPEVSLSHCLSDSSPIYFSLFCIENASVLVRCSLPCKRSGYGNSKKQLY